MIITDWCIAKNQEQPNERHGKVAWAIKKSNPVKGTKASEGLNTSILVIELKGEMGDTDFELALSRGRVPVAKVELCLH